MIPVDSRFQIKDRKTEPALRRAIETNDPDALQEALVTIAACGYGDQLPLLCLNGGTHIFTAALKANAYACAERYLSFTAKVAAPRPASMKATNEIMDALLESGPIELFDLLAESPWVEWKAGLIENLGAVHEPRYWSRRYYMLRVAIDAGANPSDVTSRNLWTNYIGPVDLPCLKLLLDAGYRDPPGTGRGLSLFYEVLLGFPGELPAGAPPGDIAVRDIAAWLLRAYPDVRGPVLPTGAGPDRPVADYPEARALADEIKTEIRSAYPNGWMRTPRFSEPVIDLVLSRVDPGYERSRSFLRSLRADELARLAKTARSLEALVDGVGHTDDSPTLWPAVFDALSADDYAFSQADLFALLRHPECVRRVADRISFDQVAPVELFSHFHGDEIPDARAAHVFSALVDAGIDMSRFKDAAGNNLLHSVLFNASEKSSLVRALLQAGFDPSGPNGAGVRPLQCALLGTTSVKDGTWSAVDSCRELLHAGADPETATEGATSFASLLENASRSSSELTECGAKYLMRELTNRQATTRVVVTPRNRRPPGL